MQHMRYQTRVITMVEEGSVNQPMKFEDGYVIKYHTKLYGYNKLYMSQYHLISIGK